MNPDEFKTLIDQLNQLELLPHAVEAIRSDAIREHVREIRKRFELEWPQGVEGTPGAPGVAGAVAGGLSAL